MQTLTQLLTSNAYVIAFVNFTAVLAGLWLIYRVMRALLRFIVGAYRTSIPRALARVREVRVVQAKIGSTDAVFFAARISRSVLLSFLFAATALGLLAMAQSTSSVEHSSEVARQGLAAVALFYAIAAAACFEHAMSFSLRVLAIREAVHSQPRD
ncbi:MULTISPECIES: hypothetical protein [Sphingomonas]|uniref:hypothetical protein n=1 Tax=Sphingomonas TaxID=13687 RepID=UPI000DEFC74B|nr:MULTISPECIES: hypothetical protein [Sphingomonas]